ncbi:peptidase family M28 family [Purpureocillium lilacinum]|uniref:Peptide hydrolase n=1 Tax=Purpureocillium lilacinum TaxID=33203 RepID=A0A179H598_PURLI|nr:peptidase family M28 family [Purpureocillium lilacinum]
MKGSSDYLPLDHDGSKSSTDMEDDMLIHRLRLVRSHSGSYMRFLTALAALLALVIYTSIIASVTWGMAKEERRHGTRFLGSPANDFITYEPYVMEQWELRGGVRYFGEPSKEVDQNWHNIFEHQNIGFSENLMHSLGREEEGIRLPDGTFFGSLMVFHHLHCLKNIYHALHPAYYQLDRLKGHEKAMHDEHTKHCLHMLMDAVMCQGDTTVLTMKWEEGGARPIGNLTSPHECVNWDRLMEWVVPNSVDVFADGVLVHPKRANVTGNGSGHEFNGSFKEAVATVFDDQMANFTMTYDAGAYLSGNGNGSTLTAQYFEGSNIYVYIRGKQDATGDWWNSENPDTMNSSVDPGGVLINSHIDSVATSYGATDDGVACVSMLQLLSHFTTEGHQPEHGIVLLFNNAEEDGLLGSRAFSSSPLLRFCRTFANLEGVGAGGRAMLFQATDYEAATAYSGIPHPLGSVIAKYGYDRGAVMSGTDYEIFANVYGLSGLDIAFYKPRSRYHTVEDDARHTSIDSIWHMLSAALEVAQSLPEKSTSGRSGGRGSRQFTDKGVWLDWLGWVWISFRVADLFAWSLTLVIVTPLTVALIIYALVRMDAWHLGNTTWGDILRFPLALVFATALTTAPLIAVARLNPLIIFSSSYVV